MAQAYVQVKVSKDFIYFFNVATFFQTNQIQRQNTASICVFLENQEEGQCD